MSDVKRIIKFRAWDNRCQEMVDWDGITGHGSTMYKIMCNPFPEYIPMQFTGLHDKNGKEIYEGDVVFKFYGTRVVKKRLEGAKGVVKFGRFLLLKDDWQIEHWVTGWYMDFDDGSGSIPITEVFEIIGNIYETPELLKS